MVSFYIGNTWYNQKHKWFFDKPLLHDVFFPVSYMQCTYTGFALGFKRYPFFTKLIDLKKSPDEILNGFKKNTRYEIIKAQREGIKTGVIEDIETFIRFLQSPNVSISANTWGEDFLRYAQKFLTITKAFVHDEPLIMHSYLVDHLTGYTRLLQSVSLKGVDTGVYNSTYKGMANRLLHFNDMLHFQKLGIQTYDLGGYAPYTSDVKLSNINDFKDSFNGTLVEYSHYISCALEIMKRLRRFLIKI